MIPGSVAGASSGGGAGPVGFRFTHAIMVNSVLVRSSGEKVSYCS